MRTARSTSDTEEPFNYCAICGWTPDPALSEQASWSAAVRHEAEAHPWTQYPLDPEGDSADSHRTSAVQVVQIGGK